ncbi:MAG TPA: DUF2064 domain-containing protein [Marmoricola sp.]|jgi:hypothetical protein|nr:DUF2064 domain-containing protein [Marmoricola sp.]
MRAQVLVVAKAPIAGKAKTRLGAVVGLQAAADLAAAALLDTLDACAQAFGDRCHLALEGDLDRASAGAEIRAALSGWQVFDQRGDTFGERLAHAHDVVARAGSGIVQVGMDTPHLTPEQLRDAAAQLEDGAEVVLGPAADGGWWVLGLADGRKASALADVPMSTPQTYAETVHALTSDGTPLVSIGQMTDVDTVEDAALVAALAPTTRFARAWAAASIGVAS